MLDSASRDLKVDLDGVFDRWQQMNRRYAKAVRNDVPFWCGERTCIALLTAAAWAEGCMAITEYDEQRMVKDRHCHRRVDLWLRARSRREYIAEAKHVRFHPSDSADALTNALDEAAGQVEDAQRYEREQRLAILFAVAKVKSERDVRTLRATAKRVPDVHYFAEARLLRPWPRSRDRYRFPGVFILGRLLPA